MKDQYKAFGRKIDGYYCVSIYDPICNEYDDTLAGPRGDIWKVGPKRYKALIVSQESEKIISFDFKDLKKWIQRIGVPFSAYKQEAYAND